MVYINLEGSGDDVTQWLKTGGLFVMSVKICVKLIERSCLDHIRYAGSRGEKDIVFGMCLDCI